MEGVLLMKGVWHYPSLPFGRLFCLLESLYDVIELRAGYCGLYTNHLDWSFQ